MAIEMYCCFQVVFFVFYQGLVHGYSDLMYKESIEYTEGEILENITANSALQCARRCSFLNGYAAIEFQGDNSTCVVLKSATKTNETTNKEQYTKAVNNTKTVCDEGWIMFSHSCYLLIPSRYNWTECEGICAAYGGYLATDTSHQETVFITKSRNDRSIWLGGLRLRNENEIQIWQWINGEKWEYTNWLPGKPEDTANGDCLTYFATRTEWNNINCSMTRKCMCEKMAT